MRALMEGSYITSLRVTFPQTGGLQSYNDALKKNERIMKIIYVVYHIESCTKKYYY
jgi:hypothetical protein